MKLRIGISIAILILLGGVGAYVWTTKQAMPSTAETAVLPISTPTPQALETWDDPAWFSFQYPAGIGMDTHEEDKENYAHLELTHPEYPGRIIVWAKDTTAASLDAWMKSDKRLKNATAMDTTIGGLNGKKLILKDPVPMLIAGTITDGIIFTVEAQPDDQVFWQQAYDTIVGSFIFTDQNTGVDGGGDSVAADEEEIVE